MAAHTRYSRKVKITPSTTAFSPPLERIYVGVTGDLLVETRAGVEIFFENIAVGFHDIQAAKVLATSDGSPTELTTATALIGIY